jgi:hypothetical protein
MAAARRLKGGEGSDLREAFLTPNCRKFLLTFVINDLLGEIEASVWKVPLPRGLIAPSLSRYSAVL